MDVDVSLDNGSSSPKAKKRSQHIMIWISLAITVTRGRGLCLSTLVETIDTESGLQRKQKILLVLRRDEDNVKHGA